MEKLCSDPHRPKAKGDVPGGRRQSQLLVGVEWHRLAVDAQGADFEKLIRPGATLALRGDTPAQATQEATNAYA